jgi:glutathione synthase/RimK-type ligase-like ATP-grasp enzyme
VQQIAFVTCSTKPDFASDDLHAVQLLQKSGVRVQAVPWDNDFSNWKSFDKVILRSCWNYHLHPEKFLTWLRKLEDEKVNLFNPVKTVRWNLHKNYLQDLAQQKVRIPQTVWLKKGASADLSDLIKQHEWNKAVIKPAVSATAHNTFLASAEQAKDYQLKFNALLQEDDFLVQCFLPEVQSEGEWSLIFFNKEFSHAILKKPKEKDFRVQNDFGGSVHCEKVPHFALKQAEKILKLVNEPLLYTRLDGIISNNEFVLMELELIEPVLFLEHHPTAAAAFVSAILS